MRCYLELFKYIPEHIEVCWNYLLHNRDSFECNLAIITKVKNEAPYILEWIEYHKLIGVERFVIYDNESDDNLQEVLAPYIRSGEVIYRFFEGNIFQSEDKFYTDSIREYRNRFKWIALIDIDEFIVPLRKKNIMEEFDEIRKTIKKKPFTSLCINWVMYGYSGYYSKQEGLVMENYTKSDGVAVQVKSIINPRTVIQFRVHFAIHFFDLKGYNEKGNPVFRGMKSFSPQLDATVDYMRINHYYTKSYEEHKQKIMRFNKLWNLPSVFPEFDPEYLSHYNDMVMTPFLPELKKALQIIE
ncbi:MAG: glycosyltransferase family 92 protein [Bacteroidales bacterium]|jgi:hypothetical protein|nr:glycosyltransferase family 92 protein [Bacteroidales bacterium]